MLVCAILGMVIERFAYRPLRNGLQDLDAHFRGNVDRAADRHAPWRATFVNSPLASSSRGRARDRFRAASRRSLDPRRTVLSSSRLNALITAIGVSLLFENGGLVVFGANPNFVPTILPRRASIARRRGGRQRPDW